MKKASFSFRALRAGGYLHRFFLGKKKRLGLPKAVLGVAISAFVSSGVSAQCDVFRNADAASPITSLVPAGTFLSGFSFADIDADGDDDLYLFYYKDNKAHFFRNRGGALHPVYKEDLTTGFPDIAPLTLRFNTTMQFVDIDKDGDYDFFITDANIYWHTDAHIHFYRNTGTRFVPRFEEDAAENPVRFATSAIQVDFTFADVDSDGDYDFSYINSDEYGNPDAQYFFNNAGTAAKPVYKLSSYSDKYPKNVSRTYYDWNKDRRLDYFQSDPYHPAAIDYYRDTATGKKPGYVKDTLSGPVFTNGAPYLFLDLNHDGSPEIFSIDGHYSTLAPVAIIADSLLQNGNTALYSAYREATYTYRWELNGKTLTVSSGYYIIPKQPGTYTLYVTNSCGTGVSMNYIFTKTAALIADSKVSSLVGESVSTVIKAYPNPFTDVFTMQLPGKSCVVKVSDMAGRVLLSQTTSAVTWQFGRQLKAGTYIVQVWQGAESIYKTTVVKQ